ncbi:MAG: ECF transporter S component, partial [Nocardioidaceae bacterium]|nr:ECF transporter S component [Nocardioidaceae bacterium]
LAVYGALAALAYGALLNMWFWPYAIGTETALSYVAGDPLGDNLQRFATFTFVTSTLGWDLGRAVTTVLGVVLLGPAVLAVLRRAARRASFAPR